MAQNAKGATHPSELREFEDKQTSAHIYQLTDHPSINHNLYFLTSSFTPDQQQVVFTSYRSGKPNFYKLILVTQFVAQAYYDWIVRFKNASNLCPT